MLDALVTSGKMLEQVARLFNDRGSVSVKYTSNTDRLYVCLAVYYGDTFEFDAIEDVLGKGVLPHSDPEHKRKNSEFFWEAVGKRRCLNIIPLLLPWIDREPLRSRLLIALEWAQTKPWGRGEDAKRANLILMPLKFDNWRATMSKKECISTHGAEGYAPGTSVDNDGNITCGACGEVIGKEGDPGLVELPLWVLREDD